MLTQSIATVDNPIDQLMEIWATVFSHQNAKSFINLMIKNGIDGITITKEDATYYVIYNLNVLQNIEVNKTSSNNTLTLYRGENVNNKGGKYYSPDKEFARQFTQSGKDSEIKSIKIKSSDVFDSKAYAGDPDAVETAISEAKKHGKRAVRLCEGEGEPQSVYVFASSFERI